MRWRCLCLYPVLLGPWLADICFGEQFPYVAYVNSGDVYVRSGPGRDYYPTDKLQKGQKVEVYRHDPGGWCAVRPPRGSFAWVSRRHLDPDSDGMATINTPRTVARVGSAFSDARDVIQVRLDKGEKVEVLEAPAEDSTWCKIAPPSGEFRWVFSKFIGRDLPDDLAADRRHAAGDVRLTSGEAGTEPAERFSTREDEAGHFATDSANRSAIDRELDRIDLALSAIVVQDISAWTFEELGRRAETALREAQTSAERGRARVLMSKLARFEDIKQRHAAIHTTGPADRQATPRGTAASAEDLERYDGVGRLSPVISDKVGGPQYALLDANNAVVSFVTAAPGVNLRPYVDRYVGVNGQRGYLTDLKRQHINVQRVTALEVQRR